MLKKLGLLVVGLMLVLAACGDDDGAATTATGLSAEEQAFADSLVTRLVADTSEGNLVAEETDARCAAEGVVAALGLERSQELFPEEGDITDLATIGAAMTPADRESFAGVLVECVDVAAPIVANIGEVTGGAVDADQQACLAGQIDAAAQKAIIIARLASTDMDPTPFVNAMGACQVDMQVVMGETLLGMGLNQAAVDCVMSNVGEDFFTNAIGALAAGDMAALATPEFMTLMGTCTAGG